MKIRKTVLFIALCMALSACGFTYDIGSPNPDKRKVSGTVLMAMKDTLTTATMAAFRLCDQGILSEGDCAVVDQTYMEVRGLLISAKKAWDEMIAVDSFDTRKSYDDLIVSIVQLTGKIETIIRRRN